MTVSGLNNHLNVYILSWLFISYLLRNRHTLFFSPSWRLVSAIAEELIFCYYFQVALSVFNISYTLVVWKSAMYHWIFFGTLPRLWSLITFHFTYIIGSASNTPCNISAALVLVLYVHDQLPILSCSLELSTGRPVVWISTLNKMERHDFS